MPRNRLTLSTARLVGHYLGYPECCVRAFEERRTTCAPIQPGLPLSKTGYIPCNTCATKSAEELTALIRSKRLCPHPFPEHRPPDIVQEALQFFIDRLHAKPIKERTPLVVEMENQLRYRLGRRTAQVAKLRSADVPLRIDR